MKAPDTHQARNAGGQEVKAAEATRTNQSDASLRKFAEIRDQGQSIKICYEGKAASREQTQTEKELLAPAPKESVKEQSQIQLADVAARKLYKKAWNSYLLRTRQSEDDVRKLIEQAEMR